MGELPVRRPVAEAPDARVQGQPRLRSGPRRRDRPRRGHGQDPQLTLVFSLVGVGIAAVMARKARRPRATFVRTAVALTVLSFVPDFTFGFDAGSAATLITLHTVAAAIVVPTLAGRLARTR